MCCGASARKRTKGTTVNAHNATSGTKKTIENEHAARLAVGSLVRWFLRPGSLPIDSSDVSLHRIEYPVKLFLGYPSRLSTEVDLLDPVDQDYLLFGVRAVC